MKLLLMAVIAFALGVVVSKKAASPLSTKRVSQIGIVVRDIEKATAVFAQVLGVEKPSIIVTEPYEQAHTQYNGQATLARAKLAFFQMENITIELIEPVGEPSTWHEYLATHGNGLHHIAFDVDDMDAQIAVLNGIGGRLEQRGDFTGGSYAYVDVTEQMGAMIELLAFRK